MAVASVAVPEAGRVDTTRTGIDAGLPTLTLTTLSLAIRKTNCVCDESAAATTSIEEPTAATRSFVGPTTVPGATVGSTVRVTLPRANPAAASFAAAASASRPTTEGTARSACEGSLTLPAASYWRKLKTRVSPAVNAPSLTSYCVGSNVAYGSPLTSRTTLPSWPLSSVPGSQRRVSPSSATTPATSLGGVGGWSSPKKAK